MSQNPNMQITFWPLIKGFNLSYFILLMIISVPASPNPRANKLPDFYKVLIKREVSYCSCSASLSLLHKSFRRIKSFSNFYFSAIFEASTGLILICSILFIMSLKGSTISLFESLSMKKAMENRIKIDVIIIKK